MSSGSIIAEYLASVGFQVDKQSLKSALTKVAAFGASVELVAAGIFAGLVKVASGEAEMARSAERLGTTSKQLQELGYIAEQSGSSLQAVTSSLESLTSKNPHIKDAAKALSVVSERMKQMNAQQQKAYAAKMGIDPSLVPALIKDTSALKEEFRSMYDVAGTDAKEAGKSSQEFMEEIGKLTTIVGMLAKSVALAFIGKIRGNISDLRKTFMENFGKIKKVFESIIKIVLRVASTIGAFVYRIIQWGSNLIDWYDKLDDSQKNIVLGLGALLVAWRLLNAGFLATPLGMIIAGLLAIIGLIDDYQTFMEGGDNYFDWSPWAETIEDVVAVLKKVCGILFSLFKSISSAIVPTFNIIKNVINHIINHFKLLGQFVTAIFSGDFGKATDIAKAIFSNFVDMVIEYFSGLWTAIRTLFSSLWEGVEENFPDFANWANGAISSIKNIFGAGIQWIKDKLNSLLSHLPDWAKKKLGLLTDKEGGSESDVITSDKKLTGSVDKAFAATNAINNTRITPSPAQAAVMNQNTQQNVALTSKTDIHMHTSDPLAAGNHVADKQSGINAQLVRHMKGAVR